MRYQKDRNAEMRAIALGLLGYLSAILLIGGTLTLLVMWLKG